MASSVAVSVVFIFGPVFSEHSSAN
jgi:hypothetical protein